MNKLTKISIIVVLTFFLGCTTSVDNVKKSLEKVVVSSGGCYGFCPFQSIEIDSSYYCQYYGGDFAEMKGYYTGNISSELWDSVTKKLNDIDYKNLDTLYENSVDDLAFEIILYYEGRRKHIFAQSMSLPDSVLNVFEWFSNIQNFIDLKMSETKLVFEAKIQFPVPPPKPPEYKQ